MEKNVSLRINLSFQDIEDYKPDFTKLFQELSKLPDIKKFDITDEKEIEPSMTISGEDFFLFLSSEISLDTKKDISFILNYLYKFANTCIDKKNKKIQLNGRIQYMVQFPTIIENSGLKFSEITNELKNHIIKASGVDKSELRTLAFNIVEKSNETYYLSFNKGTKTIRVTVRMPIQINLEYFDDIFKGFDELKQIVNKNVELSNKWVSYFGFS